MGAAVHVPVSTLECLSLVYLVVLVVAGILMVRSSAGRAGLETILDQAEDLRCQAAGRRRLPVICLLYPRPPTRGDCGTDHRRPNERRAHPVSVVVTLGP
jgi:hypothetical protein